MIIQVFPHFWYIFAGLIGFFIGVILTCILLCKKNLEMYQQISTGVSSSVGDSINTAKAIYNASAEAYEAEQNSEKTKK